MTKIITGRLLALVPVMLGIAIVTFFFIRLIPGDAVTVMLGDRYDPEVAAQLRENFRLDGSVAEQFVAWFGNVLQGDLGDSIRTGRPVTTELAERLPATLELVLSSLFVALLVALPFGVLSATKRNSRWDAGARLASLLGLSVPSFFLGVILILVFSVKLGWLPSGGYVPIQEGLLPHLAVLILPTLTLGTAMAAVTMRMTRSSLLEVLNQDYVRTARSKGLGEPRITYNHALRNALVPVVTVVGVQVGRLLGGAVVVEAVFSWPGMGTLIVRAIMQRDYPLVQGIVMVLALIFVLVNFAVDMLYIYLNPRLRHV